MLTPSMKISNTIETFIHNFSRYFFQLRWTLRNHNSITISTRDVIITYLYAHCHKLSNDTQLGPLVVIFNFAKESLNLFTTRGPSWVSFESLLQYSYRYSTVTSLSFIIKELWYFKVHTFWFIIYFILKAINCVFLDVAKIYSLH